ncbi:hypothetical protein HK102_012501, partial [Quaeritorhiza haematococci]
DDPGHRQLDGRAGAGHDEDDGPVDESTDGSAEDAGGADLLVAEHPEQLAEAGQGFGEKPRWASGSSGTILRTTTRCPADSASSTISAPDESVAVVLVSETVNTARLSDDGASARCSATDGLMLTAILLDRGSLRHDRADHVAVHVGQAEVAAGVAVGEPGVVEAEEVEDRGVEVVDVDDVLDGLVAEVGVPTPDDGACPRSQG